MSSSEDIQAYRVVIEGRVQGVGFRYSARKQAQRLRVGGNVRNRSDGSVEVICEGPADKVEQMLDWLDHGPPGARVSDTRRQRVAPSGKTGQFSIEL